MFKKNFLYFFIAFLIAFNFLVANEFPDRVYIKERWFSLTTTFDIKDDNQNIGVVYRKFFSLLPEYHLEDVYGQSLAKARMRFFSFGAKFDVYNDKDELLGLVDQKLFRFFPTFEILSPNLLTLAKAKLNFWKTKYTITDPLDNHVIAILSRPFIYFKSNWTMTIFDKNAINEKNIHPHMLLVIAAFQVDREYWQATKNQETQNQNDNNEYYSIKYNLSSINDHQNQNDEKENSNKKAIVKYLLENLYAKKDQLIDVKIDENDFQFIENYTNSEKFSNDIDFLTDDEKFYQLGKQYIDLLDTNELSQKQKKTLYKMLEQRLCL